MAKKSHSPEVIISKLREAEILLNRGAPVSKASRKIGVTQQTSFLLYMCSIMYNGKRYITVILI